MTNDYKTDKNKPPLLDAMRPFAPALVALARMMDDMQHKHRLAGAKDPFSEWKQLPDAKRRMANGMARHLIEHGPWTLNTADALAGKDAHLHATHALFNLLGALTVHLEDNAKACCAAPDATHVPAADTLPPCQCGHSRHAHTRSGGDCLEDCSCDKFEPTAKPDVGTFTATVTGVSEAQRCDSWHTEDGARCALPKGHAGRHNLTAPIHGPAGADWRETAQTGPCAGGMHALNTYTGKCARCGQPMDRCGG